MSKLTPDDLQVTSFDTTVSTIDSLVPINVVTQDKPNCWSPLCVDTYYQTCPQTVIG
jgi:hypothetical protein